MGRDTPFSVSVPSIREGVAASAGRDWLSNSMTSAYDTVTQRTGVCRDFSHLAIALCRALNIPALYFSGYAYQLDPPDFHACFECLIGGNWPEVPADRSQAAAAPCCRCATRG